MAAPLDMRDFNRGKMLRFRPSMAATISMAVILTPLWLLYATDVPEKPKAVFQAVVGTVAYLVWVFALSGAVLFPGWYNPVYGEVLLPVFTLIVAIWEAD